MRIQVEARAKVNWALGITGARADGYHELDMLMERISLSDDLTVEDADTLSLAVEPHADIDEKDNLVMRAARLLSSRAGVSRGAKMHLVKRIPARAGLGGGSADCAAALLALNKLWGLNLGMDALSGLGLALGADVPFCLTEGMARVRGIGEVVEPLAAPQGVDMLILRPGDGLSTRDVFRAYDWSPTVVAVNMPALYTALCARDFSAVRALSKNALFEPARALMPEVGLAIDALYARGARFAQMSGSGSAVFGVFDDKNILKEAISHLPGAICAHT